VLWGNTQTTVASMMKPADAQTVARVTNALDRVPLSFEINQGQTDKRVRFVAHGRHYTLFLTGNEAVLSLMRIAGPKKRAGLSTPAIPDEAAPRARHAELRWTLEGANRNPTATGLKQLPGTANYFVGNDSRRWTANIPIYAEVKYESVYPRIDLIYHGSTQHQLEYDFVVGAGADPAKIEFALGGAENMRLNPRGDLVIKLAGGEVIERAPVIYQQIGGRMRQVSGGYMLKRSNHVGFKLAAYDRHKPLIIDPQVAYSTYLGGGGNETAYAVAVDDSGHAYVTGYTDSTDFPTTKHAYQDSHGGGYYDAFVTKLNADGSALVYSTYLGGSGGEAGSGLAVDHAGHAYLTGYTNSTDFPTTKHAYQDSLGGGFYDAFVTKLSPNGSALVYSTYLGGNQSDYGNEVAVDWAGNAYVAGSTFSDNFPTTAGAYQTSLGNNNNGNGDAFVTKLNHNGSALVYSTYLGGRIGDSAQGIAVDWAGHAYVAGTTNSGNFPTTPGAYQTTSGGLTDIFVTKLNAAGSGLVYSARLGGNSYDSAFGLAVDSWGHAYVIGYTSSGNFPTTPGAYQTSFGGLNDVFVTKLNAGGSALVYSTYLGGSGADFGKGVAVDWWGHAYVTGYTYSSDFPTTGDAYQTSLGNPAGSDTDAFVTKLSPNGSALVYSTYLGGSARDSASGVAVDRWGRAYITGMTSSSNFPTTDGAYQTSFGGPSDAFVTKLSFPIGKGK
jgi:Beta-propeller repeat